MNERFECIYGHYNPFQSFVPEAIVRENLRSFLEVLFKFRSNHELRNLSGFPSFLARKKKKKSEAL
jgi:hypothetical protein